MGMRLFGGKCGGNPLNPQASAPNPRKFVIEDAEQIHDFVVAQVRYEGCTNFEGRKILVFRNYTVQQLCARAELDPHFADSVDAPFARFEPTLDGHKAAVNFAEYETRKQRILSDLKCLTTTEVVVLAKLAEGKSSATIASEMFRALKTIDVHCAHILKKLRVDRRTKAILIYAGLPVERLPVKVSTDQPTTTRRGRK